MWTSVGWSTSCSNWRRSSNGFRAFTGFGRRGRRPRSRGLALHPDAAASSPEQPARLVAHGHASSRPTTWAGGTGSLASKTLPNHVLAMEGDDDGVGAGRRHDLRRALARPARSVPGRSSPCGTSSGLAPSAIAERRGTTVNTVNSQLQRGLAQLRTRLEPRRRSWSFLPISLPEAEGEREPQAALLVGAPLAGGRRTRGRDGTAAVATPRGGSRRESSASTGRLRATLSLPERTPRSAHTRPGDRARPRGPPTASSSLPRARSRGRSRWRSRSTTRTGFGSRARTSSSNRCRTSAGRCAPRNDTPVAHDERGRAHVRVFRPRDGGSAWWLWAKELRALRGGRSADRSVALLPGPERVAGRAARAHAALERRGAGNQRKGRRLVGRGGRRHRAVRGGRGEGPASGGRHVCRSPEPLRADEQRTASSRFGDFRTGATECSSIPQAENRTRADGDVGDRRDGRAHDPRPPRWRRCCKGSRATPTAPPAEGASVRLRTRERVLSCTAGEGGRYTLTGRSPRGRSWWPPAPGPGEGARRPGTRAHRARAPDHVEPDARAMADARRSPGGRSRVSPWSGWFAMTAEREDLPWTTRWRVSDDNGFVRYSGRPNRELVLRVAATLDATTRPIPLLRGPAADGRARGPARRPPRPTHRPAWRRPWSTTRGIPQGRCDWSWSASRAQEPRS